MQTIIIVILIIFAISLFNFFKDRDKALSANVDSAGGMMQKYNKIVQALLSDPLAKIEKIERDQIIISLRTSNTFTTFFILDSFEDVEITWNADLGTLGKHKKTWTFKSNSSQEIMLQVIKEYMNSMSKRIF